MSQFLNTLEQILHSDSVRPFQGICRHFHWQVRKALHRFPCELPIAGSQLYVDRPGGVAALVNAMGEYDYNNMQLLRHVLSIGKSTFFDVGANIGSYTLVASEVADATVVSFEPHPATFALLGKSVRRNGRDNVVSLNLALSRAEGELRFTDNSESSINRVVQDGENGVGQLCVPCRRLDAVCSELNLTPDVVKIDVEGFEVAVLEGFGEFAGTAKMIFIEGGERREVRSWMEAAGYGGPLYCHFKRRALKQRKQGRPEDPVFGRLDLFDSLKARGWDVPEVVTPAGVPTGRTELRNLNYENTCG
jgi:FkbM family methyltransferase